MDFEASVGVRVGSSEEILKGLKELGFFGLKQNLTLYANFS